MGSGDEVNLIHYRTSLTLEKHLNKRREVRRYHPGIDVEDVVHELRAGEAGGRVTGKDRVEIHRVYDVRPQRGNAPERVRPPSRAERDQVWLPFGGAELVPMAVDSVAGLLRGECPSPVPQDRMDLVARPNEGPGLFREARLHAGRALR